MKEAEAITDAYMESAMNLSYNAYSEETPQDYNNYNGEAPSNYHEKSQNNSENQNQQDQNQNQQDQNNQTGEQYITVQNGEGPPQVAARAGISVDQLYQLNGIDPNNYLLYPGQQLRIK